MSRALLVIGQSHVAAFRDAARRRREADPGRPRTRVIHTRDPDYAPELIEGAEGPMLAPPLAGAIRDQIARHDPRMVSVNGGNVHAALALIRHARPFDFRLSGEPSPPLDPGAELLVESLVAASLAREMARDLARLRALVALVGPVTQLESPPPVRDDGFIAAAADAFFVDRGLASRGVAPAGLRYRMWRLASRLVRTHAAALGCPFLPVPARVTDAEGFLRPNFAGDATHGNARYGEAWIEELGG